MFPWQTKSILCNLLMLILLFVTVIVGVALWFVNLPCKDTDSPPETMRFYEINALFPYEKWK